MLNPILFAAVPALVTAQAPAPTPAPAPLLLYVTRIRRSALKGYESITGYIDNQTDTRQTVRGLQYQMMDSYNGAVVAESWAAVDKFIPPHGRITFEALIEVSDLGGVPQQRLQFKLLRFDQ